jgi:hypothetical protein
MLMRWLVVATFASMTAAASAAEVWVWQDPAAGTPASNPATMAAALQTADIPVRLATSADLASGGLKRPDVGLLVLAYGPAYPQSARAAILDYLKSGGALLCTGGTALTDPLLSTPQGVRRLSTAEDPLPGPAVMVADFEPAGITCRYASESALPDTPRAEVIAEGDGHVLHAVSENLQTYEYLGLYPPAGDAEHTILHFRARGDAATQWLCVEAQETDNSRWKVIVPLTEQWQTFRIHVGRFRSYATPERAKPGDWFHPERIKDLRFGYTKTMSGTGRHEFWLDDVAWEPGLRGEVVAAAAPLAPVPQPPLQKHFGADLAPLPGAEFPLAPPDLTLGPGAPLEPRDTLAPGVRGPASGWPVAVNADDRATVWIGRSDRMSLPLHVYGRVTDLLAARASDGTARAAGQLAVLSRGPFAGGRWAVFGLQTPDLFPADRAADLVRLVRALMQGTLPGVLEADFAVADGAPVLRAQADAVTAAPGQLADVHAQLMTLDNDTPLASGTATVTADARGCGRLLPLTAPLDAFDPRAYRVLFSLSGHPATLTVDARKTALMVAEEFLRRQQPDGNYGGIAFIDSRAATALVALYQLTGDRRFMDSAVRWGDVMLAKQREDGGYRMGYGIHADGEECFVADGGEIAMGIVTLAVRGPESERAKYRESLRHYMAYRESFRCEGGGIGVGWCKTDYGQRPTVPMKEIKKIFAPEMNTYTIGCTVGSAAAYAALWGTEQDRAQVAADARWLMARLTGLSGSVAQNLCWAHHFSRDPALRAEIEQCLRERFLKLCGAGQSWWLASGGRSAMNQFVLRYCLDSLGADAATRAEWARGLYSLCCDAAPSGLWEHRKNPAWNHNDWLLACYGVIGIIDALQPGVTVERAPADK